MSPYRQRPDPHNTVKRHLNIEQAFSNTEHDRGLSPPKLNSWAEIPYNRLIHNLDYPDKLNECIVVDREIVELIQRKTSPFLKGKITRQSITLALINPESDIVQITVWVIPVFLDGVMVYFQYAADQENLTALQELRNPAKPEEYDIKSSL